MKTINKTKILRRLEFIYLEFLSRFYYSTRYFYQKYFRRNFQKKAKQVIYKKHKRLYDLLEDIISEFKFDEGCSMTFWGDALFLLNFFMKTKPKITLELGSGASSLVFAYAADEVKKKFGMDCKIKSVDENKKYLKNLVEPKIPNDLKKYIELNFSNTQLKDYNQSLGIYYQSKPTENINLVYVDGPQFNINVYNDSSFSYIETTLAKSKKKPFDSDIIDILSKNKNLIVIVYQRISTVWELLKLTKKNLISKKYYFSAKKTVIYYN